MLVDDNPERAQMVEDNLRAAGFHVLSLLPTATGLLRQIEQHRPDVVLIDLESPDRDVLDSLSIVNDHNPTPIVMFSAQEDPDFIAQAMSSGVTAYLVDGLNPRKVKPVIDVAMAQFEMFQSLRSELSSTRSELEGRKTLEQAKGLLMEKHGLTESEAFNAIRSLAMDSNQKLSEAAASVIKMFGTLAAKGKK